MHTLAPTKPGYTYFDPKLFNAIITAPIGDGIPNDEPLPGTEPVDILDVRFGQCRWPVGGPGQFCGCPTVGIKSYCEPHLRKSRGT